MAAHPHSCRRSTQSCSSRWAAFFWSHERTLPVSFNARIRPLDLIRGKVFKDVEYAQIDWLANTHVTAVAGKYLLPLVFTTNGSNQSGFGNLQDAPLTATIGTRSSGAGDGLMLRGVAMQRPNMSAQYSAYFSARSGINQLQASRTAGGDASIFFPKARVEAGTSYQRFLQGREINSSAAYLSWQPVDSTVDIKAEYDYSYYGKGYWLEAAYRLNQSSIPAGFRNLQVVGRAQNVVPQKTAEETEFRRFGQTALTLD